MAGGVGKGARDRKSTAKAVYCSESTAKEKRSAGRLVRENDGPEEAAENGMCDIGAAGCT